MLRSVFRHRSGKYDLVKAHKQFSGMKVKTPDTKSAFSSTWAKLKLKFTSPFRVKPVLTEHETYCLSLYSEDMLMNSTYVVVYVSKSTNCGQVLQIIPVNDHPVINICLGFQNYELPRKFRGPSCPLALPDNCCYVNKVRYGLDRVLLRNLGDEEYIDGIPTQVWLDILEPAFENVMAVKNPRKRNRGPLTKRRYPCVNIYISVTAMCDLLKSPCYSPFFLYKCWSSYSYTKYML